MVTRKVFPGKEVLRWDGKMTWACSCLHWDRVPRISITAAEAPFSLP